MVDEKIDQHKRIDRQLTSQLSKRLRFSIGGEFARVDYLFLEIGRERKIGSFPFGLPCLRRLRAREPSIGVLVCLGGLRQDRGIGLSRGGRRLQRYARLRCDECGLLCLYCLNGSLVGTVPVRRYQGLFISLLPH